MKKNDFTLSQGLSFRAPERFTAETFSINGFATDICAFLNDNFKGYVEASESVGRFNTGYISICADYLTYFFKTIVSYCGGADTLFVHIESTEDSKIQISVKSASYANLTTDELRDIIREARNTGFIITTERDCITLRREYKKNSSMSVRAIQDTSLYDRFTEMFFN